MFFIYKFEKLYLDNIKEFNYKKKMKNTFSEKQIRSEEKKARVAETKWRKTGETNLLKKADAHREKASTLRMNKQTDDKKKSLMKNEKNKSDDQIINEANKFNRKIRFEGDKKMKEQLEKEKHRNENRFNTLSKMKRKKEMQEEKEKEIARLKEEYEKEQAEKKDNFIKKMKDESPELSDSVIQKRFRKYQTDTLKRNQMDANIKNLLRNIGVEDKDIETQFKNYIDYLKENKEEVPLDFELEDILEDKNLSNTEDPILEDPIPE